MGASMGGRFYAQNSQKYVRTSPSGRLQIISNIYANAGADSGFPVGASTSEAVTFQNFVCRNERILTLKGGGLDAPMQCATLNLEKSIPF